LITLNEHHCNGQVPVFLPTRAMKGLSAPCRPGAALPALLLRAVVISHRPN